MMDDRLNAAPETEPEPAPEPETFRCLEIRGGTEAIEQALELPGLEAYVYSRPFHGDRRGGDVHYLSVCGGGATVRAVVADVSGHGAAVAEFSGTLRKMVRKHIARPDQTALIRALNREFGAMAELRQFATAVVATFDAHERRLTLCNAAHPRPLWHRAEDRRWRPMAPEAADGSNLPLGIDAETPYEQFSATLSVGDVVLLYTDALIEAADPDGAMLGEAGLIALAADLDPSIPRDFGPNLLGAVGRHRGGTEADDDVTLIVLRHDGSGPRFPGPVQFPLVMAKMFGLVRV